MFRLASLAFVSIALLVSCEPAEEQPPEPSRTQSQSSSTTPPETAAVPTQTPIFTATLGLSQTIVEGLYTAFRIQFDLNYTELSEATIADVVEIEFSDRCLDLADPGRCYTNFPMEAVGGAGHIVKLAFRGREYLYHARADIEYLLFAGSPGVLDEVQNNVRQREAARLGVAESDVEIIQVEETVFATPCLQLPGESGSPELCPPPYSGATAGYIVVARVGEIEVTYHAARAGTVNRRVSGE